MNINIVPGQNAQHGGNVNVVWPEDLARSTKVLQNNRTRL